MHPYLALTRFDKPIGIWLLFFPAAWAIALTGSPQAGTLMLVVLVGAAITRAAGCIINDLTDRRLDAQVERTKHRPLASGAIPVWHAILLLGILLLAALALTLALPARVFYLALVALPMIAAYPWMKRLTWWPQLFLGLTFNLGALFGWLATGAPLIWPTFTLYAACVFWTLGYDTIYAIQDMADDATIGIRSSARRLGMHRIRPFVATCYALMVLLLALTGYGLHVPAVFYLGLVFITCHAMWQLSKLPCTAEQAGALFSSNRWLGLTLLITLMAV